MQQNLETLIEGHAKMMAEQIATAVEWAGSEEEIRHECNKLLDEFISKAGLSVRGRHEYGLAGGRIDSKYGGVVIEYKDPKGTGRITTDNNTPVITQLKRRFRDLQAEEHVGLERILGVGCDGETIVFVRMRGTKIDTETPAARHAAHGPAPTACHRLTRRPRTFLYAGEFGRPFWFR